MIIFTINKCQNNIAMKKILLMLTITLSTLMLVNAQEKFNGTVHYNLDYMGSGIEAFKGMLPNGYTFKFLNGDMLMRMEGGMAAAMMGDIVHLGKKGETYMLKPADKKALKMASDGKDSNAGSDTKVEDTGETETIAGHKCKKYKVTVTKDGENLTNYIWATKDIDVVKPKKTGGMGSGGSLFVEQIDGYPLKVQVTSNMAGMSFTMTMTADKLDNTAPSKDLFVIPSDYKVEDFDPKAFGF